MASEMAAIDLMSSTLYLQVCTVSLSPACDDELMSSCLGSLSNEELAGHLYQNVCHFKLHSQVCYTCTLQVSTRQSMATG